MTFFRILSLLLASPSSSFAALFVHTLHLSSIHRFSFPPKNVRRWICALALLRNSARVFDIRLSKRFHSTAMHIFRRTSFKTYRNVNMFIRILQIVHFLSCFFFFGVNFDL